MTGAFDHARVASLPADDWRKSAAEFTTNLDANLALVEVLRSVAERLGTTPGVVAVAWTLAFDAVTGARRRRPASAPGAGGRLDRCP